MTDAYVEAKKALISAGYTLNNAIGVWSPPTCQGCGEFREDCTCQRDTLPDRIGATLAKISLAAQTPQTKKDDKGIDNRATQRALDRPQYHGDRCECNLCCWAKKHPQCRPRDGHGSENRGTQRVLDDLGATIEQVSPATHEGMPAGDFAGIDPRGKTPRPPFKCTCDPCRSKWAKGYRDSGGYLTCSRCSGRIY